MIKANELRIGNAALLNGKAVCIKEIMCNHVTFDSFELPVVSGSCDICELVPIALAPAVLGRFGFESHAIGYYRIDEFFISYSNTGLFQFQFRDYQVSFRYLHTLQNLYYALTGEELEYRP